MSQIHDADFELRGGPYQRHGAVQTRKGASIDFFEHGRTWETCSVSSVFPETYTCNVYTERGKLLTGLAWPGAPREISPPQVGERMFVHFHAQVGTLMRAPPMAPLPPMPKSEVSAIAGVGASVKIPTALTGTLNQQPRLSGSAPRDVLPGDWLRRSPEGNFVGVLDGGVNIMRSGEFCQIQTIADAKTGDELINIVARTIRMFSGAGVLNFSTDNGKTSMVFGIGADEETESSPNEEFFRVRASMGQDGNLANFRITDAKGKSAYFMQIFPTGDTWVTQRSEVRNVDLGWKLLADSFGLTARNGNGLIQARGDVDINAGGSLRARSFGRLALRAVGGNASLRSSRSVNINSGNTMSITANGPLIPLIPFLARSMDIVAKNGSVVFDIGSPLSGDFQLTQSGFRVNVGSVGGSVRFSTGPAGGFVVDSITPLSVKLGGPPIAPHPSPIDPGLFTAVLFEPLLAALEALAVAFDSHVHLIPEGISLPPIAPIQTGIVSAVAPLIPSKFVRFGG